MPGQQPVPGACAACGSPTVPGAAFCGACGAGHADVARSAVPAAPLRSPASGERRQLTVVFCDLEGSTALSARLDPEDYYALVQSYHDRADELVSRYGGTVAQYLGDGVLAYFGWPAAH